MGFDNAMWHFDEGVTGFFGQWNIYSTALATLLIGIITVYVASRRDPDTHPFLLARQAQSLPIRNEGESPVYRSTGAPPGMPLNSGLNVRDSGVSKWAQGRDGDLRDIWRRAVNGVPEGEAAAGVSGGAGAVAGTAVGGVGAVGAPGLGRILTVNGNDMVETTLDDITRQINLIGQHILDQGGARVAIYLPNSVEFLAALFACSFYNLTAILLPFDQPHDVVVAMLRRSAADTVVTAAGCFPFDAVVRSYPALRQVVWVVDDGSAHLDWNEVPEGVGSSINVSTWQDIVSDAAPTAGRDLPPFEGQSQPRDITVFWEAATVGGLNVGSKSAAGKESSSSSSTPPAAAAPEMVRFTSGNLVSAVAAQLFAVPTAQRIGPADLFLPADSLTHTHTLVLTLAALYANASVALNSAAPAAVDLTAATRSIAPTVVVASPAALLQTHHEALARLGGGILANALLRWQTSILTEGGALPAATSLVSRFLDRARPAIGDGHTNAPGKLRILYAAERAGAGTPAVSAAVLSNLRIFTGSRVIYGLAAAKVAGAAAQTGFYDYRVAPGTHAPFGPPLTSTEYLVRDKGEHTVTGDKMEGEIIVRGPSVAGGEAALGVIGVIRDDNTLAYA